MNKIYFNNKSNNKNNNWDKNGNKKDTNKATKDKVIIIGIIHKINKFPKIAKIENCLKLEIKMGVDNNWTDKVILIILIMFCFFSLLEKIFIKKNDIIGWIYIIARIAKKDKTKPKSAHKNKGLINNINNPIRNKIRLISYNCPKVKALMDRTAIKVALIAEAGDSTKNK